jgi:hypothetical protein
MKKMLLYAAGMALATPAMAVFITTPEIPIERLITNTSAYMREHPDDAMGPYTLARIHYLAFAKRSSRFSTYGKGRPPAIEDTFGRIARQEIPSPVPAPAPAWTDDQLRKHLAAAVENYQKAIRMNPKSGLFHLGLASVAESAATSGIKLIPIPGQRVSSSVSNDVLAGQWRELAIAEYFSAYELSAREDTGIQFRPVSGLGSLVSYESGQRFVAMVGARGEREGEAQKLASVQATLQTLSSKPMGAITPIVFRLGDAAPLADLLDSRRTVVFDLDGTGRPQQYSWVRADTAFLVLDMGNTGRITSGHQLFGSVSFNMFWSDGYRALDALDDNRDGVLRESELAGLAVWFDRNQDGVSEPGEVVPITKAGIAAISARSTGSDGDSLMNSTGLTMSDGRVLPTYDWTTEPLDCDCKIPIS